MTKLKSFVVVLVMLMLFGVFAGCGKSSGKKTTKDTEVSKETIYELYNKVQLNQTKEQVYEELGNYKKQNTESENIFSFVNKDTGYGVSVIINNNQVNIKGLVYPTLEGIISLCGGEYTREQADMITKGTSYEDVVELLEGEGVETNKICSVKNEICTTFYWVNKDGSGIAVVIGADGKSQYSMFIDSFQ